MMKIKKLPLILLFTAALLLVFAACSDFEGEVGTAESMRLSDSAPSGGGTGGGTQAGVLTAGEWNDLENWNFWQSLFRHEEWQSELNKTASRWGIYAKANRMILNVTRQNGFPAVGQTVKITQQGTVLWESVTDQSGQVVCWPYLFEDISEHETNPLALNIYINGEIVPQHPSSETTVSIIMPQVQPVISQLEVMFVVDATGSMGDELEYLKTELLDVLQSVKTSNAAMSVKSGAVFYRDIGDEYVTRFQDLTTDPTATVRFIKEQEANGGGDYPERAEKGLKEAIERASWSANAKSKVIFLILDAPPHADPEVAEQLRLSLQMAAQKGIRIVPIAASGVNKSTEFLLRFMALATNGTYVFLTDDSGIGEAHLTPTVGKYDVEFLNNLMVRLLNEYAR